MEPEPREPATILSLPVSVLCMVLARTGNLAQVARCLGVCRAWRHAGEWPELWRFVAARLHCPDAGAVESLADLLAVAARSQTFDCALSLPQSDGRLLVTFAGDAATSPLFQAALPLLPSTLSPGVSYFEFCISGFDHPMPAFSVGFARRGSRQVLGVASGGVVFLTPSHPSSFRAMELGSVRGLGLEWETRQMFVTAGNELLYFEKIDWRACGEPLYPTVLFERVPPKAARVSMLFRFAGAAFVFDLRQHVATRRPEVATYLRLIRQQ